MELSSPIVMGILNATPDSFFAPSRVQTEEAIARRADEIVAEGGQVIDVGAFSTRPGGQAVSEQEEMSRLRLALSVVRRCQPDAVVSVDTFRPDVARMAVEEFGALIINDVSEGGMAAFGGVSIPPDEDGVPAMFRMIARLRVPYVLMSVKPSIDLMLKAFAAEVNMLHALGVPDIILDPGFGFGKTLEENYQVMALLDRLQVFGLPVLAGVSRKSMISKLLGCDAGDTLNATTALHAVALMKGVKILRVHDVAEAVEAVRILLKIEN
jgi:dihydropteroate synthase